jgi:hypothetical protein
VQRRWWVVGVGCGTAWCDGGNRRKNKDNLVKGVAKRKKYQASIKGMGITIFNLLVILKRG